ncbi:MAG: hypothetical protein EHM87_06315 [Burkholderiales bacterium]|nr:MAG: hypothetical protein EHM87_06315 [Burkholderiales bacterium]
MNATPRARGSLLQGMAPTIEAILAPHLALESLVRRAAHGSRPALRLLIDHGPRVIEAEGRWLYPALLHRLPGGAQRVQMLPFTAEHEQMLELIGHVAAGGSGLSDPMFLALQWLVLRHGRAERRWLEAAIAADRPRDDTALRRFVVHCRPLLDDMERLARQGVPTRAAGAAVAQAPATTTARAGSRR